VIGVRCSVLIYDTNQSHQMGCCSWGGVSSRLDRTVAAGSLGAGNIPRKVSWAPPRTPSEKIMIVQKESAKLSIRGLAVSPLEDGKIAVSINRSFTKSDGSTELKHPMTIDCLVHEKLYPSFASVEAGDYVEIEGLLVPYHYVFVPLREVKNGDILVIPDADKPDGTSRPWDIVNDPDWKYLMAHCSSFRCIATGMGGNTSTSLGSIVTVEQSDLPEYDEASAQAFMSSRGLSDTTGQQERKPSKSGHSIQLVADGRIFDAPDRVSFTEKDERGNSTPFASFQLKVRREESNPSPLTPISIRVTVWHELAHAISGARDGTEIALKGFLDPRWILWRPNPQAPKKGTAITLSESPDEGKANRILSPAELWNAADWNYNFHLYQTFQGVAREAAIAGGETIVDSSTRSGPQKAIAATASPTGEGSKEPTSDAIRLRSLYNSQMPPSKE